MQLTFGALPWSGSSPVKRVKPPKVMRPNVPCADVSSRSRSTRTSPAAGQEALERRDEAGEPAPAADDRQADRQALALVLRGLELGLHLRGRLAVLCAFHCVRRELAAEDLDRAALLDRLLVE